MLHDTIDLDRFALDRLDTAQGIDLVTRCRSELDRDGLFNLEGLVRPAALARIVAAVRPLLAREAFTHRRRHNVYFDPRVEDLPADHPALTEFETTNHTICSDRIPGSELVALYEWPPFAAFLAAVMDKPRLHVMDDPLACLNVMAYHDGDALSWHFDRSEFTTTLLLQAPQRGGEFQYRTDLRDDHDPGYERIGEFLSGDQADAVTVPLTAGTLNVFKGKHTVHRVSPVSGPRDRIIAVFSYYERPGVRFSAEEQIGFYGRSLG